MIRYGFALIAGVLVFAMLVPTSGAASRCYSLLAVGVPCEGVISAAAGLTTAAIVGGVLWLAGRRGLA